MKPLIFYPCLLAILFQAISASTFSDERATLKSNGSSHPKTKSVVRKTFEKKTVKKEEPIKSTKPDKPTQPEKPDKPTKPEKPDKPTKPDKLTQPDKPDKLTKPTQLTKPDKPTKPTKSDKPDKIKDVVVEKSKPKSLVDLLSRKLVAIIIAYFNDDTYPFIVAAYNWPLEPNLVMTVDSARVYATLSTGMQCIYHAFANFKADVECHLKIDNPEWSEYYVTSSFDGRYISVSRKHNKTLTDHVKQTPFVTQWLAQHSELEPGKIKYIVIDSEDSSLGRLSRDGHMLLTYNKVTNATRVYKIKEEAGKDPTAVMKFELNGEARAISGKGNRVMLSNEEKLEIYDVSKDASKLVCRIDVDIFSCSCALNEDGGEAAFDEEDALRIVKVDSVGRNKARQSAIVKVPESLGEVAKLVYSDENKLHVLHRNGKVSLFDPAAKTFILLEAPRKRQKGINKVPLYNVRTRVPISIEVPQKRQKVVQAAISPNADYIAILQRVHKEKRGDDRVYRVIVKRKLGSAEWSDLFGYKVDKEAVKQS